MDADLKAHRTFKAECEALLAKAPNPRMRTAVENMIHDDVDDAIYVIEREIEYAIQYESLRFSEGMGGNDPANARAAFIEEQLSDRLA